MTDASFNSALLEIGQPAKNYSTVCLEVDSIPSVQELIYLDTGYSVLSRSGLVDSNRLFENSMAPQIFELAIQRCL